jgi:ParB-like chromosome segregation protein Spo0J
MVIANQTTLDVACWEPRLVTPCDRNSRITAGAIHAVAVSIREFGFRQPIAVDTDREIICDHTRLKSAQTLDHIASISYWR